MVHKSHLCSAGSAKLCRCRCNTGDKTTNHAQNNPANRLNPAISVFLLAMATIANGQAAEADSYLTKTAIPYRTSADSSVARMCVLDVYYPVGVKDFPTVVWFHGGGLTSGKREIPQRLTNQGIAVVAVDYRLSPHVKVVDCIDDAAAAAVDAHNIQYMAAAEQFVTVIQLGYLTSMIGLDKKWLKKYEIDVDAIAGLIPYSATPSRIHRTQGT